MEYQVWTKDAYTDTYTKVDCGDLGAVKRELDLAVRAGQEPILTVEVPYSLAIKIDDVGTEKKTPKERWAKAVKEPLEEENIEANQVEAESHQHPLD